MSAMSFILLFSLSLWGAEFSFIANSVWGFGSRVVFPKNVVLIYILSLKTKERRGSSIGMKPNISLIFGWM